MLQTSLDDLDYLEANLGFMTAEEREEYEHLIASTPIPVWAPLPGPQEVAFDSDADVVGYGGAAGGGKTDLMLGKALLKHRRIAVFRLNGTEHEAFIDRIEEVLGSRDGFNSQKGIWRNAGPRLVQIEMLSIPNMGDERKYRGRPHDGKFFDEVSEIPEYQVRFLLGWLRTTIPGQKCQAILAFNPPTTAEGRWVIEFFAPWLDPKHPNPAMPGELRWFAMCDGEELEVVDGRPFVLRGIHKIYDFNPKEHKPNQIIQPQSRTFVPAKVDDNPYLIGTSYMTQLQSLPEPLRSQLLYGDFNAGMEDDAMQVIPTAWIDAAMARWVDYAPKGEMMSEGVDVARGGKDNTTIARRHRHPTNINGKANWFDKALVYPGTTTPDGPTVAGLTMAANRNQAVIHIDVIGVGSSPYDFLVEANQQVVGVNVSQTATGTDKSGMLRFSNQRTQDWWRMREELDPANDTGIMLPPDKLLATELAAPKWRLKGKVIEVESRDEIIKRIKRSADRASAYILALRDSPKLAYVAEVRRANQAEHSSTGGIGHNPYENM